MILDFAREVMAWVDCSRKVNADNRNLHQVVGEGVIKSGTWQV